MKNNNMLVFAVIILAAAFFVGCAEQDSITGDGDEINELPDNEDAESVDEDELKEDNNEVEGAEDLAEADDLEEDDPSQAEGFSSTVNPFQAFKQARENRIPIVLKFYSDT